MDGLQGTIYNDFILIPDEFVVGLQNEFKMLEGHGIGYFTGLECNKDICEALVQLGT